MILKASHLDSLTTCAPLLPPQRHAFRIQRAVHAWTTRVITGAPLLRRRQAERACSGMSKILTHTQGLHIITPIPASRTITAAILTASLVLGATRQILTPAGSYATFLSVVARAAPHRPPLRLKHQLQHHRNLRRRQLQHHRNLHRRHRR